MALQRSEDSFYDTTNQSLTGSEKTFRQKLIQYFKRYTKYSSSEDGIECIRRSQRHFSSQIKYGNLASIYIDSVFAVIEIFRITDGDLIRNALEEYLLLILFRMRQIEGNLEPPTLFRRFPKSGITYRLQGTGFKRVFSLHSFFCCNYGICRPHHSQRLLRYGLRFVYDEELRPFIDGWIVGHIVTTRLARFTQEEEKRIPALLDEHYPTYSEKKRLYFIMVHITIATAKETKRDYIYENVMKTLKLLYMWMPDPVITIAEVERLLNITMMGKSEESKIRNFCKMLVRTVPTTDQPAQPRTLIHLCCCRVRDRLIEVRKQPHGVWSLQLPASIRNYILLQNSEHEFLEDYLPHLVRKKRSNYEPRRSKRQKTSRAQ